MIRPPPRSTPTDTLFPYTTLFRSHFVKAKQLRLGRDGIHHGRNGIARFLLSLFTQPVVDLQHELVKMDAAFGLELHALVTQVHQQGLAARTEERRVGQECVSTGRTRGAS